MIRSKPQSCIGCSCYDHGTDFCAVEGTGSSGVMLVSEASGEHEQRDQLPMRPYAPAGSVLQRILARMGLSRSQFSIVNVLRCRPKRNWLEGAPWEFSALAHCRPNLDAAIRECRPRCIMAIGGVALRELTGMSGPARGVSHLAGYVLPMVERRRVSVPDDPFGDPDPTLQLNTDGEWSAVRPVPDSIPVIGNFHTAFLRRGKASYQGVFARILKRALNIAAGSDNRWTWGVDPAEWSTYGGLKYQTNPSSDDARAFRGWVRDNPNAPIAEDLETLESVSVDEDAREGFIDTQIRLVQFSAGRGTAIAFPWEEPFIDIAADIINSPNPKYGHNWNLFDHKVLRAVAAREGWVYAPRGPVYDTLDLFHHWQPDLPAHLQFASLFVEFPFPWKHLAATDIEFYGCCDADSDWRLGEMLVRVLKHEGLWDDTGYEVAA